MAVRKLAGDDLSWITADLFRFHPDPGSYLAFLGRASPEKRVDRAIEIAKRVGMPLKIAAKVDPADRRYFKREIEPLLNDPHIEWLGEISDKDKDEFLGNAYALLFPIDWPEPFGLVMIESMACGTPVIAYAGGSVAEVMDDGVTGFVVNEIEQAVEAVRRVRDLSRARCREVFEKRFTASRMANDYIDVYTRLADSRMRRVDQSLESSMRSFQSASPADDKLRGLSESRISKILSATHAHFVRSPRFLFVAGASVPCLQQQRTQNQKKKGKGKEGL